MFSALIIGFDFETDIGYELAARSAVVVDAMLDADGMQLHPFRATWLPITISASLTNKVST